MTGVSGTLETEGRKTWQLVASFTFGQFLLYFRPPSATLAKIHHQPPSLQDLEPALIVTFSLFEQLVKLTISQLGGLRVPVAACCNDGDPDQLIDLTLLNRPPYIFRSCVGVGDGKAECGYGGLEGRLWPRSCWGVGFSMLTSCK